MDLYDRLAAAIRAQEPVAEVTVVAGPVIGAKALAYLDGRIEGTLELGALEEQVAADARAALTYDRAETASYEQPDGQPVQVFIQAHAPLPRLVIVGAGHTSIPLAAIARLIGFNVTLIDARSAFATRERFPEVEQIIIDWPHLVLERIGITPNTFVAVLTHDAKFEEPLLPLLLRSPARYIGVIGSRRTQVQRRERLRAEGFGEDDIARLSGPIGLDLGAVTPEEIALSIMGEVVAAQHGRSGGSLTQKFLASLS